MKIVIAMDSFKGTLRSDEACEIVAQAVVECAPEVEVVIKPMADGGEGTARAMMKAAHGRWIPQTVTGPLPDMEVQAGFAWFDADSTALIEMASASGLELLSKEQMNPLKTTTYGTGQLVKSSLDYGAHKILLAVGGSSTVDGGIGAAMALGWVFLDSKGNPVQLGGQGLEQITEIIRPNDLRLAPVEVLCDVNNPLCGENGAARIYGPQKGATPQMVGQLERGLAHLADLVEKHLQLDICNVPGAGAAGGLAAGAMAFMNATLVSGIETVVARSNLLAELTNADWVITGEGSFDDQSLRGKVVAGVLKLARQSGTRLALVAGQVNLPAYEYDKLGIAAAFSCRQDSMSLHYALENSRSLLREAAQRFAKDHLT